MKTYHEVKFKHDTKTTHPNFKRNTLAYLQPDFKSLLRKYIKAIEALETPVVSLTVGHAIVHPEDAFVKKVGRELAESKLEIKDFVMHVEDNPEYYFMMFEREENRLEYSIGAKLYKDSKKFRITSISVYDERGM